MNLLSLFNNQGQGSPVGLSSWRKRRILDVPNSEFNWKPFDIYQDADGTFDIGTFDLQSHANISVSTTYYVDVNTGNDGNSGADWDNALKGLDTAIGKGDADRIYIAKGYYGRLDSWGGSSPGRSMEIIGDLSRGVGNAVYVTMDYKPQLSSWSLDGNHYEHTGATVTVVAVIDKSNLTANNVFTPLTLKASEAEVDANVNSWYYAGGATDELYIRTFDDREPDSDILILTVQVAPNVTEDNATFYFENIVFWAYNTNLRNSSSTGGLKVYLKNCELGYANNADANLLGVDEAILQNCKFYGSLGSDGISSSLRNTITGKRAEIDCEAYDNGVDSSDQGSTSHDGSNVIRVNGEYFDQPGQCIADTGAGGYIWMVGSYMHDSDTDIAYQANDPDSWLDTCIIDGKLTEGGDGTIFIRNCTISGAQTGNIQSY